MPAKSTPKVKEDASKVTESEDKHEDTAPQQQARAAPQPEARVTRLQHVSQRSPKFEYIPVPIDKEHYDQPDYDWEAEWHGGD